MIYRNKTIIFHNKILIADMEATLKEIDVESVNDTIGSPNNSEWIKRGLYEYRKSNIKKFIKELEDEIHQLKETR